MLIIFVLQLSIQKKIVTLKWYICGVYALNIFNLNKSLILYSQDFTHFKYPAHAKRPAHKKVSVFPVFFQFIYASRFLKPNLVFKCSKYIKTCFSSSERASNNTRVRAYYTIKKKKRRCRARARL